MPVVAPRDDPSHPLHQVYRRRMRWVRLRWFWSGLFVGILSGVLLALGLSIYAAARMPSFVQDATGQSDVSVVISEGYLNRRAAGKIGDGYATGVAGMTATALGIDLKEGDRMDLRPTFKVEALFTQFDLNVTVSNQLSVEDGKLVLKMVGDPQLGNFDVPLGLLPFDLKAQVTGAVDKVNNDIMIAELNQSLQGSFGGSSYLIEKVATDETGMIVGMKAP